MTECLPTCELRGGVVLAPAGGTWLDNVTQQLTDRFRISQ
jgi:hypothetical protein